MCISLVDIVQLYYKHGARNIKICVNLIPPTQPTPSKQSPSLSFPHQKSACMSLLPTI